MLILQKIKLIIDLIKAFRDTKEHRLVIVIGLLFTGVLTFYFVSAPAFFDKEQSKTYYHNAVRDDNILRKSTEILQTCGNKTSVVVGVLSTSEKVGVIKSFYSYDDSCIVNAKEKNTEYQKGYVVDDLSYSFLQEIGKTNQTVTIDLVNGNITMPLSRNRYHLSDFIALHEIMRNSKWYAKGDLKMLKIASIVDKNNVVLFTISVSTPNECIASSSLISDIKDIINQTRIKNAISIF